RDGEPLGERAALHLGDGEPARDPGPGPAREPALRRPGRLPRARGGRDAVRLAADRGPPAEPEGGELRAPLGDEGPGDRGSRPATARGPAERHGSGGGDRALPAPAAARADTGVRRRTFLIAGALVGLGAPAAAVTDGPVRVTVAPSSPQPGDVVLLEIGSAPSDVRAEWDGRPLALFPTAHGVAALVGIDLDVRPGPIAWRVTRPSVAKNGGALAAGAVAVRARTFPTQPLTLPKGMVDLDAPTLARVETEREELKAALAAGAAERLWRGAFRIPVDGGQPTGGF